MSVIPDGKVVKDFRGYRGWSQEELAEAAGLSVREIQKIEGSRRDRPASVERDTLRHVAECLNTPERPCTIGDLITTNGHLPSARVTRLLETLISDFDRAVRDALNAVTAAALENEKALHGKDVNEALAPLTRGRNDLAEVMTIGLSRAQRDYLHLRSSGWSDDRIRERFNWSERTLTDFRKAVAQALTDNGGRIRGKKI